MPDRPKYPCRKPGCPALTDGGYCHEHRNDRWEVHKAGRTTTQRGYGASWRKLRKRILERDYYQCQTCRKDGRIKTATDVDHITPKARGGDDSPRNLQSLCHDCHREKTHKERADRSSGA